MPSDAREVVSADGLAIRASEQGHGPPILIVHGGGGTAEAWAGVVRHLRVRFRVLSFDRRPYLTPGKVDVTATMENEVNDVLALAATVGEPVLLVGHSSGGVVALESALASSTRFASPTPFAGMVLYEPPVAVTEPLGGDALVRAQAALVAGDPGRALEIHLREIVRAPALLINLLRLVGPLWRRAALFAPGQIHDDANIESLGVGIGRYAELNVPALLLGGARSPAHLRVRLEALVSVLPAVDSLVVMPHQGHLANAFAPRQVARIIAQFADRVAPR
jgi:pimeloyl-ACP methyl ester carboxylesterase